MALQIFEKSSASSKACAIAGDAPTANNILAAMSMETKLLIFQTNGDFVLISLSKSPGLASFK